MRAIIAEIATQVYRVPLARLLIGKHFARRSRVLHVVDASPDVDQRLQHRIPGDVLDALAV